MEIQFSYRKDPMGKITKQIPANSPDVISTSHDQIARRADEIAKQKGQQPGQSKENWQQAERELTQKKAPAGYPEQHETPSPGRTGNEPTSKDADAPPRAGRRPAAGRT